MSKTFCVLPWIHLASHPHGGVTTCCISDHTKGKNRARNFSESGDQFKNLGTHSIDEIINSDYFRQTRQQMLNGEKPKECWRCYEDEDKGVTSKRQTENSNFSSYDYEQVKSLTSEDGSIDPNIVFAELRLGNICNLKCRSCNPASSSKMVKEYADVEENLTFVTKYGKIEGFDWPKMPEMWIDLEKHCENLKLIYINGGEPTLVNEHWTFLKRLIENGVSSEIDLWYNINLTNLPKFAYNIWKEFNKVKVSCSVDDLHKRNTYLRDGSSWPTVKNTLSNLMYLQQVKDDISLEIDITQTLGWSNVFYINEFHTFFSKKMNLYHHLNWIYDPKFLSAWHLPDQIKQQILDKCKYVLPESVFNSLSITLLKDRDDELFQQGIQYNKFLDLKRRQSFKEHFPELANELIKLGYKDIS